MKRGMDRAIEPEGEFGILLAMRLGAEVQEVQECPMN